VQISYIEFQPNRKINLESAGKNSFTSLRKLTAFSEEFTKSTTHQHCADIFYIEFQPYSPWYTESYSTLQYRGTHWVDFTSLILLDSYVVKNILFILLSAVSYFDLLLSPFFLHSRFSLSSLAQHATQLCATLSLLEHQPSCLSVKCTHATSW